MYQEFYVARIDEIDSMEIAAKCRREAAKLYGLLLKHHGLLKHLGRTPCLVKIVLKGNTNDSHGQCFKLWDAGDKVYAECFITPKRVSFISYITMLCNSLQCYVIHYNVYTVRYKLQVSSSLQKV